MRHTSPSSSSSRLSSWTSHKLAGKDHFERGNYEEALTCYRSALNPEYNCPPAERQIILSNVVACRLKLGGPAQARAAVEDAKQCIALNDQWAKSHIRLASAYIALEGHSNDACNALQRALQLDPGNVTARQMLMRELRRDRVAPATTPSAPPEDQDDTFSQPFSDMPRASHTDERGQQQRATRDDHNIDDSLPILDRLKLYYMRSVSWYCSQSEDIQTLCKLALAILVLYVAFGGRFGLGYLFSAGDEAPNTRQRRAGSYQRAAFPSGRGNYEPGNAYDRFYHGDRTTHKRNMHTGESGHQREAPRMGSYEYQYRPKTAAQRGSSFSLLDGNLVSIMLLLGMSFCCYRLGINPLHVLMMMNLFTAQRGGGGFRRMYGMGYGMPRPWWGGGHPAAGFARPRNGWF